jgi:hypothetical protein
MPSIVDVPLVLASTVDTPLSADVPVVAVPLVLPVEKIEPLLLPVENIEPLLAPVENADPLWTPICPDDPVVAPDVLVLDPLDSVSCPVVPPFAQPNPIAEPSKTIAMLCTPLLTTTLARRS